MLVYLFVFFVALYYLYYAENNNKTRSKALLAWFLGGTSIFIGMGDMIGGYDRYIYGEIFDDTADIRLAGGSVREVFNMAGAFSEKGYMLLGYFISFLTANRYVFILMATMVMYMLYYHSIKKYTDNYPLACIVFLGFFYYFTATYFRQALAVGIVWLSVEFIIKRNFPVFLLLVLLAWSFHASALIFLPMFFIGGRRFSIYRVFIFLFICFVLGFSPLPQIIISYSGEAAEMEERFAHSASDWGGARVDYVIEVLFFLWVLYKNRHSIPTDRRSLVFFNLLYGFCAILLLFMRMGQGGRFGWYFMIGIIYVLSYLSVKRGIIKDMKLFVILLCFALFFRITNEWAFNLTPYKTFLSNGYPCGERYIYEKYEYDGNYTKDKFYRPVFILFSSKNNSSNTDVQ